MDARNHRVSVAADERGGEGGEGNRRVNASGRRWRLRGRFPDGELEGAPYPTLVRHLLWHRGLRSAEGARRGMVVRADCGTSSIAEVTHARGLGMDVLIVDHHSVPPQLPAAVATVNPKRPDSRYPDAELATVGLAYKLMGALNESMGRGGDGERWLDLVALGTVADVAPLLNENRWLLKRGLERLARSERPGLRALMEASGIEAAKVDAEAIAYGLAPRLNAAGRLKHARLALELLLERDEGEAQRRAAELTALNRERQEQTAAAMALAAELLEADGDPSAPLIFLGHEDIPSGIVRLVARP